MIKKIKFCDEKICSDLHSVTLAMTITPIKNAGQLARAVVVAVRSGSTTASVQTQQVEAEEQNSMVTFYVRFCFEK